MYCSHCGTRNPDTSNFCSKCGSPLSGKTSRGSRPPMTEVGFARQLEIQRLRDDLDEVSNALGSARRSHKISFRLGIALAVLVPYYFFLIPALNSESVPTIDIEPALIPNLIMLLLCFLLMVAMLFGIPSGIVEIRRRFAGNALIGNWVFFLILFMLILMAAAVIGVPSFFRHKKEIAKLEEDQSAMRAKLEKLQAEAA